jgi:hypothetical protein
MKKKITVAVALGFVLAGSAAAQASALTSLASHRQQYDFAGRKMPVSAARIFSVDEETAPPILGGSFLQIIDKSMARTTPGKMRVAENQAGRISVKGSGISTIADREIFYKPKLAPDGTDQFFTGGSISLINARGNSTVSSSKLPYTAGNLVFNITPEMTMSETNMSTRSNISASVFSDRHVLPVLPAGSLDVELTAMNPSPVPLPAAVSLLGSGMALLCIARRRNEEV